MSKIKIVFMGTSDFAIPALEALIAEQNFEIVAVYSKEPKISGRGYKITNSSIHNLALKHNLKVLTPQNFKDTKEQNIFASLKADIAVVVAYGLILTKEILQIPKLGCLNIHPSILPRWRGAAPIQRAIMSGDKQTGVAIIKMDQGLDSGDVLAEEIISLDDEINYQDLAAKLAVIGANLLIKTIRNLEKGVLQPKKQDQSQVIYASKISKEEFLLDWNVSARQVNDKIRALNGCGGAYFELNGEKIKIYQAKVIDHLNCQKAGKIIDQNLTIACQNGAIQPQILQRAGKNKMSLPDFLRGFKIM